jgi:hypothetical protein
MPEKINIQPPIGYSEFNNVVTGSKHINLCYPRELVDDKKFPTRPLIYFSRQPVKNSEIHDSPLVIAFPIPGGLGFSDSASWDGSLDGLLSTALAGASQETIESLSCGEGAREAAGKFIGSIIDKATGSTAKDKALSALSFGASMTPGGDKIQSIMNAASRSIPNPNVISQFTGSGQRTFSFKFSMVASDAAEAKIIQDIVKYFRISAYAEGSSLRLNYPPEWNISFMMGRKEMDTLPKIANVVLTQVDTNFNSQSGYSFHKDGSPIDVDLTVGFKETRVMTANDIVALEKEGSMAIRYKTRPAYQSPAEAVGDDTVSDTLDGPSPIAVSRVTNDIQEIINRNR